MVLQLLRLVRPQQYVKNGFLFMPLFFSLRIDDIHLLWRTLVAFVLFSAIASSVYILNDISDINEDKAHPIKKHRPLASGAVSKRLAMSIMFVLLVFGEVAAFLLDHVFFFILSGYFLINLAYSLILKHVSILDITIIAAGFVLRIYAGAIIVDVPVSMWIVLMTFLLALFLALAKRRDDVLLAADGRQIRKNIDGYNLEFVSASMVIMAAVVLVSYILYTVSPDVQARFHSHYLYATAFFVVLGILRYLQLALVYNNTANPTDIVLRDRFLQAAIGCWLASFALIAYT